MKDIILQMELMKRVNKLNSIYDEIKAINKAFVDDYKWIKILSYNHKEIYKNLPETRFLLDNYFQYSYLEFAQEILENVVFGKNNKKNNVPKLPNERELCLQLVGKASIGINDYINIRKESEYKFLNNIKKLTSLAEQYDNLNNQLAIFINDNLENYKYVHTNGMVGYNFRFNNKEDVISFKKFNDVSLEMGEMLERMDQYIENNKNTLNNIISDNEENLVENKKDIVKAEEEKKTETKISKDPEIDPNGVNIRHGNFDIKQQKDGELFIKFNPFGNLDGEGKQ